ncbi:MAG: cytochrome c biogenesis protein CcsA [Planctomycetia bacterium]|nr:cytochrome c biogenesis protein CcsA [Planctomycetia bacterium]
MSRDSKEQPSRAPAANAERRILGLWDLTKLVLSPLASLKLTVVLFGLSIFLILAGTLAQAEQNLKDVLAQYFRTPIAWIDLKVFLPKSFFPNVGDIRGGFPFPGGFLLGFALFVNLIAAHLVRFTVQARGQRLVMGVLLVGAGFVATLLVIVSGMDVPGLTGAGFQAQPLLKWPALWELFKICLAAIDIAAVLGFFLAEKGRVVERWTLLISAILLAVALGTLFWLGDDVTPNDSSMRILWQLMKATFAGAVLLTGCIFLFRRRAGVVLLHSGVGLLLLGELLVATQAVEGQMHIFEGQTVNHLYHIDDLELAVIDPSDPKEDRVVVVPEKLFRGDAGSRGALGVLRSLTRRVFGSSQPDGQGPVVEHKLLPFKIQCIKFIRNAALRELEPGEETLATAGIGLKYAAVERPPATGADGDETDLSVAYVKFERPGAAPATHLVALRLSGQFGDRIPERVVVGRTTYEVFLRFRRTYKPYQVTLNDASRVNYLGTDKPRDYSSLIVIKDARGQSHEQHIWMNNPLRYGGETFYQSGHHPGEGTMSESTTLSVVSNGGWMIPYVACMIVVVGMIAQFTLTLFRFVYRVNPELRTAAPAAAEPAKGRGAKGPRHRASHAPRIPPPLAPPAPPEAPWRIWVRRGFHYGMPAFVVLVFAAYLASRTVTPRPTLGELGKQAEALSSAVDDAAQIVKDAGRPGGLNETASADLARRAAELKFPSVDAVRPLDASAAQLLADGEKGWRAAVETFQRQTNQPGGANQREVEAFGNAALAAALKLDRAGAILRDKGSARERLARLLDFALAQQRTVTEAAQRDAAGKSLDAKRATDLAEQQQTIADDLAMASSEAEASQSPETAAVKKMRDAAKAAAKTLQDLVANPGQASVAGDLKGLARTSAKLEKDLIASADGLREGLAGFDYYRFGKLPVAYEGRVKPMDTLARNSLRVISDTEGFTDPAGRRRASVQWLLDSIANGAISQHHRVFRIDSPEVLGVFGLPRREGLRYSLAEMESELPKFEELVRKARKIDKKLLSTEQRRYLELERRILLFHRISGSFDVPRLPQIPTPEERASDPQSAAQKDRVIRTVILRMGDLRNDQVPNAVPIADPLKELGQQAWEPLFSASAMARIVPQKHNESTDALEAILDAYANGDAVAFNVGLAHYERLLGEQPPQDYSARRSSFEAFFNHFQAFASASGIYVVAFGITILGWLATLLGWHRPLQRTAFWLIVFTLLIHTAALVGRIYISGRPPVTNLYSSAVYIGWLVVVFGIILEAVFRLGFGNFVAAVAGFATLLISHFLAGDGDTFTVLQAVLDTQFWLATHVVCITSGYGATLLAGLLGIVYLFGGRFLPDLARVLVSAIYGVLCFALFFSFFGTVLGGLWADDSWGRFWGWDPKENGALIIVLWNALVLHARWGGMVRERGLAVLAVAGNITTSWSWFGVNELGVGLHSYGFTEGVLLALGIFVATQLFTIAVGALPLEHWWQKLVASLSPPPQDAPLPTALGALPVAPPLVPPAAPTSRPGGA